MGIQKTILICIPYAGASATSIYQKWNYFINDSIEVVPLELSGHGIKMDEPLLYTMDEIVEYLFENLKKIYLHSKFSYAFFGHSMGTIVIYELMKRIYKFNLIPPIHIFVSGRYTPNHSEIKHISNLNDDDFRKEIISYGGIPTEILEDTSILDFFIPSIKADYTSIESYIFVPSVIWNVDISVFSGKEDDDIKYYDYSEWKNFTRGKTDFYEFNGDHFFINSEYKQIIKIIEKTL